MSQKNHASALILFLIFLHFYYLFTLFFVNVLLVDNAKIFFYFFFYLSSHFLFSHFCYNLFRFFLFSFLRLRFTRRRKKKKNKSCRKTKTKCQINCTIWLTTISCMLMNTRQILIQTRRIKKTIFKNFKI